MSEEMTDVASNEQPKKRGRKAIATKETVAQAAEQLKSQNARVTVRGIMRALEGGSPNTVVELLKQLPDARPSIDTAVAVPDALTKLWKSSVAEFMKNMLDECQQKLQTAADEVKDINGDMYDLEARVIELETALAQATTERDLARGERDQLREAVHQASQQATANLERAQKAETQEALSRQLAEEMVQRAQVAEVRSDEHEQSHAALQQKLSGARDENIRLRGQIDGMLQAQQLAVAGNPAPPPRLRGTDLTTNRPGSALDAGDTPASDDAPT